jgi:hypothetical protein
MSQKSASMARRLFAAMPHSPVPSVNGPVRTHLCVRSEQPATTTKGCKRIFTASIKLTEAQYAHFDSLRERTGCETITEMFRMAAFRLWPMPGSATSKPTPTNSGVTQKSLKSDSRVTQEEKNEEREKSPHTPLKEKEARKEEPLYAGERTREARFVKPTVEEIAAYCRSRNNGLDANQIWDFYESKGWLIGKSKMKDWRAAVRTWERRKKDEPSSASDSSSRYHNGRPKLSNHVNISEAEKNSILRQIGI